MTYVKYQPDAVHQLWFKKEQGRFLKKARQRAGLSVLDVARRTGIDIRWVESGEVNLQARNLCFLVRLYSVPEDYFMTWQAYVSVQLKRIAPPRSFH